MSKITVQTEIKSKRRMIRYNGINLNEKQKNILMVLDQIAVCGETYTTDIIKATGLSFATISRAIAVLKKSGVVVTKGKEITDMGRWPEIYSLNTDYGYLLHFYMDTESIQGYLSDFCGTILARGQIEIDRNVMPEAFGKNLRECSEIMLEKCKTTYDKVLAASIAIPGMVDTKNSMIKRIPNFTNFKNINLFRFAEKALGVPVIINNEARLCAFGAFIYEFPESPNLVYIDFTKYSGIGAGIVVDGKLVSGRNGFAGEIGDMLVDIRNFENGFNENEGWLETMAGLGVLYSKLYNLIKRGRAGKLKELMVKEGTETLTLQMVEKAVLRQDMDVVDVFDDTMKMWAVAVINLFATLDPDLLILGGMVSVKNDVVFARIRHYISKILFRDVNIVMGKSIEYQVFGGLHMLKTHVLNTMLAGRLFDLN
jgi:predicted NBD/HSP70 family sugar kinase